MSSENPLDLVRRALVRNRRIFSILGGVFVAFALLIVFASLSDRPDEPGSAWLMFGLFFSLGALMIWFAWAKCSPERSPVLIALEQRPSDVAWFYVQEVFVNGIRSPSGNVYLYLVGRTRPYFINVPNRKREAFLHALRTLVPHATEGYSVERLLRFNKDPHARVT